MGKSAFLAVIYRSLPLGPTTYLPGHRQIIFNNGVETVGQDAAQLRQNLYQHHDNFGRYKNSWAEEQFKSIVRALVNAEAAYNRDFRHRAASGQTEIDSYARTESSPLDILNNLFKTARLPVQFVLNTGGIEAERLGSIYAIDALSDGERAALFLSAAIIVQPSNSVILIDEPEKHLHPSIAGILIDAALRARTDIAVIMASHDVHLIERISVTHIIHIRNSRLLTIRPENRVFEAQLMDNAKAIPEDLRRDLLGTRSRILFIEGEQTSIDIALYGHVYQDVKVAPKGGHEKVVEAVKALGSMNAEQWIKPYGLIDGDGRDDNEIETLKYRRIYSLPCPSVENLFFLDEAIACFVQADLGFKNGDSLEVRLEKLDRNIGNDARTEASEIIAKRASWRLERELSAKKRGPKSLKSGKLEPIIIDLAAIVDEVDKEINNIIGRKDWREILQAVPIKDTGLPHIAAKHLGARSFSEYCKVILRQLDTKTPLGICYLSALTRRLPVLDA